MYDVSYTCHFQNVVDTGRVIVCAASNEQASDIVTATLALPPSRTRLNVVRIKPSIFQVERREIDRQPARRRHNGGGNSIPPPNDLMPYRLLVSAVVRGRSESNAIRKLAEHLIDRTRANNSSAAHAHIAGLLVECAAPEQQRQVKALEAVELYRAKRFV